MSAISSRNGVMIDGCLEGPYGTRCILNHMQKCSILAKIGCHILKLYLATLVMPFFFYRPIEPIYGVPAYLEVYFWL